MTFTIHAGDAVTIMRGMPSESVDCVITDPPYGDTSCAWDDPVDGWLPEVRRLLKPSGSLWFFTSMRHLLNLVPSISGWAYAQDIVWEKHNGSSLAVDRFRRVHEHAVQLYPAGRPWAGVYRQPQYTMDAQPKRVRRRMKPAHWGRIGDSEYSSIAGGPRLARSVLRVRSCHGHALHPTQKPEGIIEPLVLYSCPPGGTIFDPFTGSGTTGAVAVRNDRHFIGAELDPTYAAVARRRIAEAVAAGRQERATWEATS